MNYKTAKAVNELYACHTLAIGLWIWTTSKVLGTVVLDDHSAICFILSFLMWTASNFSWDLYWISRCCLLCSVPTIYSVSYNSSFVQAWITLGRAQLNFGEPDKAIESFERALAIKVHNQMCHCISVYIVLLFQDIFIEDMKLWLLTWYLVDTYQMVTGGNATKDSASYTC